MVTIATQSQHCNKLLYMVRYIGAFGIDFAHNVDNVKEGLNKVSEGLLQYGVTGFCPTLVSSSPDVYRKVSILDPRTIVQYNMCCIFSHQVLPEMGATTGAVNLGVHVEGPFISKSQFGAHDVRNLRTLEGVSHTLGDCHPRTFGSCTHSNLCFRVLKIWRRCTAVWTISRSSL
jgi:N-acetylglucosamine-6-phosphate deacetylase